jgi:hypothetical protein
MYEFHGFSVNLSKNLNANVRLGPVITSNSSFLVPAARDSRWVDGKWRNGHKPAYTTNDMLVMGGALLCKRLGR